MSRPEVCVRWLGPKCWLGSSRQRLLRPHQAEAVMAALMAMEGRGYRLLRHRRGLILADDVGMGKTREGIAAVVLYLARHREAPIFLVPPALREKWVDEIHQFCDDALRVTPRQSAVYRVVRRMKRNTKDWVLSTTKLKGYLRRAASHRVKVVVLDEAHKVRNAQSVLSINLKRLIEKSDARLL